MRIRTDAAVSAREARTQAALAAFAEDLKASAFLLEAGDPLRGYVEMLAALPPDPDAWTEVVSPWLVDLRHGRGPVLTGRGGLAAAGAIGVAALRTARALPADLPLAGVLRAASRWCFWLVQGR